MSHTTELIGWFAVMVPVGSILGWHIGERIKQRRRERDARIDQDIYDYIDEVNRDT